ncbi:MAG: formimidoylglutamate deiminase [Alphaproteobacteria bacterium]|nr:formimidoylglutamate deiminase [Alphaproteobacteria bacterium]
MRKLRFAAALLPEGVAEDVTIGIGSDGLIGTIATGQGDDGAEREAGLALPGMPNLHSHAHQRAMAGLAERSGNSADSFWTWRQTMYRFLERMGPEEFEAVAAQLYLEMLQAGYTSLAEFHYLHRDPAGAPYGDPAEMSRRVFAAARETGIALTHLPVLYAASGFGGAPLGPGQKRFAMDAEGALALLAALEPECGPLRRLGLAPHSLRAAPPEQLAAALHGLKPGQPVHIHIAEQVKEVEDCLAWSGRRPVEWLLDAHGIDADWCLVHATHLSADELARLAASGATAGLCPTTEANLGDGFFAAADYLAQGGTFGIGSDSHISVSPVEELRWLEYGERLRRRGRALLAGGSDRSTGRALLEGALTGGARALAQPVGRLAPGSRADLIVLDTDHPLLAGRRGEALIDSWIFAGNRSPVRHVMVGGDWVIRDGHHEAEERIGARFRQAMRRLTE